MNSKSNILGVKNSKLINNSGSRPTLINTNHHDCATRSSSSTLFLLSLWPLESIKSSLPIISLSDSSKEPDVSLSSASSLAISSLISSKSHAPSLSSLYSSVFKRKRLVKNLHDNQIVNLTNNQANENWSKRNNNLKENNSKNVESKSIMLAKQNKALVSPSLEQTPTIASKSSSKLKIKASFLKNKLKNKLFEKKSSHDDVAREKCIIEDEVALIKMVTASASNKTKKLKNKNPNKKLTNKQNVNSELS
jgi:hypothetical protein